MTNEELKNKLDSVQCAVSMFAMETYGIILPTFTINPRLIRALGRTKIRTTRGKVVPYAIELSEKLLASYPLEVCIDVGKHECIHFALCLAGRPFNDNDLEFICECKVHGVSLTKQHKCNFGHIYQCACGCQVQVIRKLNSRYVYSCVAHHESLKYVGYTSNFQNYKETGIL